MNKTQITAIVDGAMDNAMNEYIKFVQTKHKYTGLEKTFQMWFAKFLDRELMNTNTPGYFTVYGEYRCDFRNTNVVKGSPRDYLRKDFIDLAIEYEEDEESFFYFIELKFKKTENNQGAAGPQVEAYTDVYKLEQHVDTEDCVKAYFIFLTDMETYKNPGNRSGKRGTRAELPLSQNTKINSGVWYKGTTPAVQKYENSENCNDGFIYRNGYVVDYKNFNVDEKTSSGMVNKDYWYFVINID